MKQVHVGSVRIAYAETGDGPPVVLLHGGVLDSRSWRRQLEGLCDDFTVLAWDAPGCGRSDEPPQTWRMPDYADAVAGWLDAIGVEHPHVVGLSWGSSVALELYRRHPSLPVSLILASAYAGWAGSLSSDEVSARLSSVLSVADLPPSELRSAWPGVWSSAATPELVAELEAITMDNAGSVRPTGYRAMAYSMAEADLRDVLPEIRIPTLLIYGEHDERSPLSIARELHARIPSAELSVIPGVGHMCSAEAPEEFNMHVRRFVQSIGDG